MFLTVGANENDPLCIWIFYEAGHFLGRHILAVAPNMDRVSHVTFDLKGFMIMHY